MAWTWHEYKEQKRTLGDRLVLVDMIDYPILDSVPISEELFSGKHSE
jgi:gentisate 1,2-dioxygenase